MSNHEQWCGCALPTTSDCCRFHIETQAKRSCDSAEPTKWAGEDTNANTAKCCYTHIVSQAVKAALNDCGYWREDRQDAEQFINADIVMSLDEKTADRSLLELLHDIGPRLGKTDDHETLFLWAFGRTSYRLIDHIRTQARLRRGDRAAEPDYETPTDDGGRPPLDGFDVAAIYAASRNNPPAEFFSPESSIDAKRALIDIVMLVGGPDAEVGGVAYRVVFRRQTVQSAATDLAASSEPDAPAEALKRRTNAIKKRWYRELDDVRTRHDIPRRNDSGYDPS